MRQLILALVMMLGGCATHLDAQPTNSATSQQDRSEKAQVDLSKEMER